MSRSVEDHNFTLSIIINHNWDVSDRASEKGTRYCCKFGLPGRAKVIRLLWNSIEEMHEQHYFVFKSKKYEDSATFFIHNLLQFENIYGNKICHLKRNDFYRKQMKENSLSGPSGFFGLIFCSLRHILYPAPPARSRGLNCCDGQRCF